MNNFLHKLFGTTPGKGVQPKEALAYSVAGFGLHHYRLVHNRIYDGCASFRCRRR